MTWQRSTVRLDALPPGTTLETSAGSTPLLLARVGPLVFAVEPVCPHVGGILAEGTLSGRRLECPVHGAVFDVGTGAVLIDPFGVDPPQGGAAPLGCYPTRTVDGWVEVDVPDAPPHP